MKMRIFSLLILLALTIGLAGQTSRVGAEGSEHVIATAIGTSLCFVPEGTPMHPDCNFVEPVILPNGRAQITGMVDVVEFTSSDPRWNVMCRCSAKPFIISDGPYPIMANFICTPTDPTLEGWWEGSTTQVFNPDKYIARFTAQGYGAFEGLMTISRNSMSSHPYDEIEIFELPGYEQ